VHADTTDDDRKPRTPGCCEEITMDTASWFHWSGGVYFRRAEDGTVEIGEGPDFDNVTVLHRIDPSSWASIVSTVSARGEDHETYNEALRFHSADA
jgi:hypothetical protein